MKVLGWWEQRIKKTLNKKRKTAGKRRKEIASQRGGRKRKRVWNWARPSKKKSPKGGPKQNRL